MPKSYSVSRVKFGHSSFACLMVKIVSNFGNFDGRTAVLNIWMFHVKYYSILPISCVIWRIYRWIIQVLTVHRMIPLIPDGRILQSGLATDRIWGSTSAVLLVELSRKLKRNKQLSWTIFFVLYIYCWRCPSPLFSVICLPQLIKVSSSTPVNF